jgi:glucosamine--fructose-6-phosphate aminotransferase (isomerizing)
MCGIFGFVAAEGRPMDPSTLEGMLSELFILSEPRGKEASGLVFSAGSAAHVYKRPMPPTEMLRTPGYAAFLAEQMQRVTFRDGRLAAPMAAMGHCRLVTNGGQTRPENNQPIVGQRTIGIHNGIVVNHEALWRDVAADTPPPESDTVVVVRLIDEEADRTGDVVTAVRAAFARIQGTASVAILRADAEAMVLATNIGSLYVAALPGFTVFTSEGFSLSEFLRGRGLPTDGVRHLRAGDAAVVDAKTAALTLFRLDADEPRAAAPAHLHALTLRDMQPPALSLKRCSRCILPATYPFIDFDAQGVCNYCRDYTPPALHGHDALVAELDKHRRSDGRADCIVALSGGRDSSYGLHLLKKEYGMNPIAYSYDWGMVTDIARRNQARMCAQLEVEHIFRAADIPAKRRYMRKNIQAWLRRPHLGMVPLFMAGDKYFYGIGRELRKELDLPLVVFCAGNPLERTDFKGGFAGVRESWHGQRLFAFSLANKIQIAAFYASQYLMNPAYLNESLLDTIGSFYTTFIGKDDFLYLFHYLPWEEPVIEDVLINQYGWETAAHTKNTWRIGDGYTSFINHIYYTLAGFSEFDTYRSQQIRMGLIDRERALAMTEVDNQADLGVLSQFCAQVGLNLEEVLSAIDRIPKRTG